MPDLSAAYLAKRCKQVAPGWKIAVVPEKKAYSREEKRGRLAYAKEAVQRPMEYWRSTVFYDTHVFFCRPTALPSIHIAGRRRRPHKKCTDKRRKVYPWGYPKMHFAYAVHWKLGVIGPFWISDTTGYKKAKKYKASSAAHLPPIDVGLAPVVAQHARVEVVGGGV